MNAKTKRHIREFACDLKDALQTKWLGVTYIIRVMTERRGGTRIIIINPNHPMEACRQKIFRAYRFDRAIEKAVREAFGFTGLNYLTEYENAQTKKGVANMAAKKLSGKGTKKVAKKKASGVRRKKVTDKVENVCAHGNGRQTCSQVLKSKRELKTGLCEAHIKAEAESKKAKTAAKRSEAKQSKAAPKTATKVTKKSATKSSGNGRGGSGRVLIMGFPATSFIRSCAELGLSLDDSKKCVKKLAGKGAKMPADATFKLSHNQGGYEGWKHAELTGAQKKEIKAFKS